MLTGVSFKKGGEELIARSKKFVCFRGNWRYLSKSLNKSNPLDWGERGDTCVHERKGCCVKKSSQMRRALVGKGEPQAALTQMDLY